MITAGPAPPAPGKARTPATSRTGILTLPTGRGRTSPRWAPEALANDRVASTGIGSRGAPAVSASWPATGCGGAPAAWTRCPDPTVNVSAAASPLARQEVTAGTTPGACGSARPAADAAACQRSRAPHRRTGPEAAGGARGDRQATDGQRHAGGRAALLGPQRVAPGCRTGVRRRREPRQLVAHRQSQEPQRVAGPARCVQDGGQVMVSAIGGQRPGRDAVDGARAVLHGQAHLPGAQAAAAQPAGLATGLGGAGRQQRGHHGEPGGTTRQDQAWSPGRRG